MQDDVITTLCEIRLLACKHTENDSPNGSDRADGGKEKKHKTGMRAELTAKRAQILNAAPEVGSDAHDMYPIQVLG